MEGSSYIMECPFDAPLLNVETAKAESIIVRGILWNIPTTVTAPPTEGITVNESFDVTTRISRKKRSTGIFVCFVCFVLLS